MLRSPLLRGGFAVALCTALLAGCGGGGYDTGGGAPVITSIEPASGALLGGTHIALRGQHLANPTPGDYEVLVGGQPARNLVVVDDTQVELDTPPGSLGAVDITVVTADGEMTLPDAFTYHNPPTVTAISPDEGPRVGGTFVTVTGTGFSENDPGETTCLIGLKELQDLVVVDDTTLTGSTPSGWFEVPKDVVVENRNGRATLLNGYQYRGPTPVVSSVAPSAGARAGGELITITGEHYTTTGGALSVQIGPREATLVTRIDDETLTCITPFSPVPGFFDVKVGNNNGFGLLADGFYYRPEPEPTSITPSEGTIDGGTSVTITGQYFTTSGATTVSFGGEVASNVVIVNDNTITCDTPQGTDFGLVDLIIQNDNGPGTLPGAFTYTAPQFWWEETFGPGFSAPSYYAYELVSLPDGFPFFGTLWNDVNVEALGHLDFGAVNTSYSSAHLLFTFPHITPMGQIFNPSTTNNVHYTSHVPGRTIITYDRVPEYSATGSNSVQVHLHHTGYFAFVYKGLTFHQGPYNPWGTVAVNPGSGTQTLVDWTSGSHSGGATDALSEQFTGITDLSNSVLVFVPNSAGGYDSTYSSGVPADPNP